MTTARRVLSAFFASSVSAEVGGDPRTILLVKTCIFYVLFALVPLMVTAGVSGQCLAGKSQAQVIRNKARRMRLVGLNDSAVLVPCVATLYWFASHGRFGAAFAAVQAVESVATAPASELESVAATHRALMEEAKRRGVFVAADPLQTTSTATTVRRQGERVLTLDGPFAETKEQLAGYYILECADLDEAIAWAARIPTNCAGGHGCVEIRPLRTAYLAGGSVHDFDRETPAPLVVP